MGSTLVVVAAQPPPQVARLDPQYLTSPLLATPEVVDMLAGIARYAGVRRIALDVDFTTLRGSFSIDDVYGYRFEVYGGAEGYGYMLLGRRLTGTRFFRGMGFGIYGMVLALYLSQQVPLFAMQLAYNRQKVASIEDLLTHIFNITSPADLF